MSFWGIEVKPGRPVTHYFDPTRGRLRISQATLGIGDGVTRSLVQCNVGNKTPVLLCALLPDKTESCHLELEFEEADDVIFSVLGPRSVHLTGYYVGKSLHRNENSNTESYGEDIANTDNEVSNQCSDEDDYDDSFINDDDDPVAFPSSPAPSDGDGDGDGEDKHPENRKGNRKRLKKKHKLVIESEEDNSSQESEDEDDCYLSASISKIPTKKYYVFESEDDNNAHENKGEESCLLSAFKNKTHAKARSSKCREKRAKVTDDEATGQAENGGSGEDGREENVDAVDMTSMSNISKDQLSGIDKLILAPEHDSVTGKIAMPSKCEDAKSPEVAVSDQGDMFTSLNTEQLTEFDKEYQVHVGTEHVQKVAIDLNTVDHSDSLEPPTEEQVENSPKLTKNGSDRMGLHECKGSSPGGAVEEVKQVAEATDMDEDLLATTEDTNVLTSAQNIVDDSDSLESAPEVKDENGPKSKKRKKGSDGVKLNECKDSCPGDAVEEVKPVVATDMDTDVLATTEDNKVLSSIQNVVDSSDSLETHAEEQAECGPKLKKRKKGSEGVRLNECKDSSTSDSLEEAKQVDEATDIDKDLPAMTEDNEVLTSTRSIDVNSDEADGCQLEKKHKKKKKKKTKVKDAETNSMLESDRTTANEISAKSQDMDLNPESSQVRTLSNGLIIEDLAKGKEDGKVATPGRKVKVYYTGKLKENGYVFSSNVGDTPYKFCLGDEQVLEGWNIGLEGMRVGDKRRLTIPPAMGFGSEGLGEDVPPNSWLIYDVELVGIRG